MNSQTAARDLQQDRVAMKNTQQKSRNSKMNTIKRTAHLTGLFYIAMVPLSIFGIMYVPMALIVPDNALTTVNNIVSSANVFRMSIGVARAGQPPQALQRGD